MKLEAIRNFFDQRASVWDEVNERNEDHIRRILDAAKIGEGNRVLDVACGTGVLILDYLARGAELVVGVDISSEMIRIAKSKITDPRVMFINDDIDNIGEGFSFDRVMVYNAFPHFVDPKELIRKISGIVKPGGTVTIAHGASREDINACHSELTREIAVDLIPADEVAGLFDESIEITTVTDSDVYIVSGRKKNLPQS